MTSREHTRYIFEVFLNFIEVFRRVIIVSMNLNFTYINSFRILEKKKLCKSFLKRSLLLMQYQY
jgi:hypothetical protein